MSLLDNPAEWAEATVGRRYKLLLICAAHVFLGVTAIVITRNNGIDGGMTFGILLFGIAFPCMYLYALKSLLDKYRQLVPK